MSGQQRSRVVFVGNLPFDHTEEQLVEVFSSVGPVVSFRLVFDHGTGKPKGFGFCEYKDPETAASALRNLQGVEVGGRGLRLDFADTDDAPPSKRGPPTSSAAMSSNHHNFGGGAGAGGAGGGGIGGAGGGAGGGGYGRREESKLLPAGVPLNGGSATDSISQTLATMPPGQLLDIMSQMKALVTTSPFEARTLLTSNPQLAYALFQAMLMMNIVDAGVLQKMLPQTGAPPQQQQQQQRDPYPTSSNPNSYNGRSDARGPPPQQQQQQQQQQGGYGRDERYGGGYGGGGGGGGGGYGNQGPPPPVAKPVPAAVAPDQAAVIAQVLAMTQAQIDMLPPEHRNTILQIRAQAAATMGGGGRR